jgi:HlyD family secretion protein
MAMGHIPASASRKAWGAFATLAALTLAVWGSSRTSIDAVSAQESHSNSGGNASASTAVALARLLPASGLISVGVRPGMRVVELKVKEDDQVAAGAELAVLEGHDSAQRQLEIAEAQKRRGEHERAVRINAARKAAEASKRRLDEGRTLYNQFGGTVKGKERYDAEMALYQVEMQAINAQLDLDLAQGADGNPEEAILKAQVEQATAALRETEVLASAPGRVLRVLAHSGEVSSGVLLLMGDVSSMVAKAEVYQSDIPRIHPGDPAEVNILGTKVAGKVSRVGSIVGKNQLMSVDPRALRDLRVIEVTIQLDEAAPANRYIDMEVEAVIRPSSSAGEPVPSAAGGSTRSPG